MKGKNGRKKKGRKTRRRPGCGLTTNSSKIIASSDPTVSSVERAAHRRVLSFFIHYLNNQNPLPLKTSYTDSSDCGYLLTTKISHVYPYLGRPVRVLASKPHQPYLYEKQYAKTSRTIRLAWSVFLVLDHCLLLF